MKDHDRLAMLHKGQFVGGELILIVDGKHMSAGRKKFDGFEYTKEGKRLRDELPAREARVEPTPEPVPAPVEKPTRRRKRRTEKLDEADAE